jgi:hypothetical protein
MGLLGNARYDGFLENGRSPKGCEKFQFHIRNQCINVTFETALLRTRQLDKLLEDYSVKAIKAVTTAKGERILIAYFEKYEDVQKHSRMDNQDS